MTSAEQLCALYAATYGHQPTEVIPLAPAASPRQYFRLTGTPTVIGTLGTNVRENEAFIYFAGRFEEAGLHSPRVLAVSPDRLTYLQSDLGSTSVYPELATSHLEQAMALLPRFQAITDIDRDICFPRAKMDVRAITWDLNYFKYEFLLPSGIHIDEDELENDFSTLAHDLLPLKQALIIRDYQSRNLMVTPTGLAVIDFQGARLGDPLYDVASFLWQARANIAPGERERLADIYFKSAGMSPDHERLRLFALFRTLQVLGTYGFRGLVEGKARFVESIPPAIRNLSDLLPQAAPYPELHQDLANLIEVWRHRLPLPDAGLTVRIYSFGFRKSGYPRDYSGNGGGFVFDCRALPNPGRLPEYKSLTGMDAPVQEYLRRFSEPKQFINQAVTMVSESVDRYLKRGFSSLQVAFGCTGGQHRSVYCACQTARTLKELFPEVRIVLTHTEQPQLPEWTL